MQAYMCCKQHSRKIIDLEMWLPQARFQLPVAALKIPYLEEELMSEIM